MGEMRSTSQHGGVEEIVKLGLNVGSGQRPFNPVFGEIQWINIDSQERWNPDICCNGSKVPYDDQSVDYFVLHHVLEHFGCNEGLGLVREAYRVLKPNGSLLVFVPNVRELACQWMRGKLSTQLYLTNIYGAYMGDEADRHKWGFDMGSLFEFLSQVPFKMITDFNYRSIPGADIAQDWWIIGMEAIR